MADLSSDYSHDFFIRSPGLRPPFGQVVDHVYGKDAVVDTEGDSYPATSVEWTWLYMQLRQQPYHDQPVVEVMMLDEARTLMRVSSDDKDLAEVTANYLAERTGGVLDSAPTS